MADLLRGVLYDEALPDFIDIPCAEGVLAGIIKINLTSDSAHLLRFVGPGITLQSAFARGTGNVRTLANTPLMSCRQSHRTIPNLATDGGYEKFGAARSAMRRCTRVRVRVLGVQSVDRKSGAGLGKSLTAQLGADQMYAAVSRLGYVAM